MLHGQPTTVEAGGGPGRALLAQGRSRHPWEPHPPQEAGALPGRGPQPRSRAAE